MAYFPANSGVSLTNYETSESVTLANGDNHIYPSVPSGKNVIALVGSFPGTGNQIVLKGIRYDSGEGKWDVRVWNYINASTTATFYFTWIVA